MQWKDGVITVLTLALLLLLWPVAEQPEQIISPYHEYLPLMFRVGNDWFVYYDDPYIVTRMKHHAYSMQQGNCYCSWLAWGRTFGYGSYEWMVYGQGNETNSKLYLGILEGHHGYYDCLISVCWQVNAWKFLTIYNTSQMETIIDDVNFSEAHTFTIHWSSTYCTLHIDSKLYAYHIGPSIPQEPMQLFNEVTIENGDTVSDPAVYFRNRSFHEVD